MLPAGNAASPFAPEAEAFVRFCYQRRRVGWPELYDEMCAVATRGLFQGMGHDALAEVGVGFSLFETPRLAQLVTRIAAEEQAARKAAKAGFCPLTTAAQGGDERGDPERRVEIDQARRGDIDKARVELEDSRILAASAA